MDKFELAIEETKILQGIIARHDDISFRLKSWCITLNIGILAALYGIGEGTLELPAYLICIFLVLVVVFFIWMEAIYRVAMNRAIQRTAVIEKEIQINELQTYPKINETLGKPNRFIDQIRTLSNIRVIAPYFIILVIDGVAVLFKILSL